MSSSGSRTGSSEFEMGWVEWFCSIRGNEFFVEVDEHFIKDDFNLCGLAAQVKPFEQALDTILDMEVDVESRGGGGGEQNRQCQQVEEAAQLLYGLIHARYLLTPRGMTLMLNKHNVYIYGTCPNRQCDLLHQQVLPLGLSDSVRDEGVKVFCPRCRDVYEPCNPRLADVEGAYFGTSFAHMFLMEYPHLATSPTLYIPRICGYRVHPAARWACSAEASERDKFAAWSQRLVRERFAIGGDAHAAGAASALEDLGAAAGPSPASSSSRPLGEEWVAGVAGEASTGRPAKAAPDATVAEDASVAEMAATGEGGRRAGGGER